MKKLSKFAKPKDNSVLLTLLASTPEHSLYVIQPAAHHFTRKLLF